MLSDLRAFIISDATVASYAGQRMHPVILPQHVIFPALSYAQVSGTRLYDLCGPTGRVRMRVTINSWAENYADVRALAEAVRLRIEGPLGAVGQSPGEVIDDVKLDNEIDFFEPEGATVGVYRVAQDYIFSFAEP